MSGSVIEAVSQAAAEIAAQLAVEVYHIEMSGRTLRVLIDTPTGVSLETCSRFSQALSDELDRQDLITSRYFLEVSSPGIERPLYRPRDYAAVLGRNVRVQTAAGVIEGRLVGADQTGVKLEISHDGEPAQATLDYQEIRSARVRASDAELFSKQQEPQ
ncbi:MAG: ribosome maturation factor RimP [candidate division WOR-3 bacterium]